LEYPRCSLGNLHPADPSQAQQLPQLARFNFAFVCYLFAFEIAPCVMFRIDIFDLLDSQLVMVESDWNFIMNSMFIASLMHREREYFKQTRIICINTALRAWQFVNHTSHSKPS